jgi:hypothetical protein
MTLDQEHGGWNSEGGRLHQGITGVSWYHYFSPEDASFFTIAGAGIGTSHFADSYSHPSGPGLVLGCGFQSGRHFQLAFRIAPAKGSRGDSSFRYTTRFFTMSVLMY